MSPIKPILAVVVSVLLATTQLVVAIWLGYATPQLVLAAILAWILLDEQTLAIWFIGVGGLILDLNSTGPIGLHLLLFTVISFGLLQLRRRVFQKPSPAAAWLGFFFLALFFEAAAGLILGQLAFQIIVPAVLTAIVAALFYRISSIVYSKGEVIRLA